MDDATRMERGRSISTVQIRSRDTKGISASVQPLCGGRVDFEKCKNAPGFVFAHDQIRKRSRLAN